MRAVDEVDLEEQGVEVVDGRDAARSVLGSDAEAQELGRVVRDERAVGARLCVLLLELLEPVEAQADVEVLVELVLRPDVRAVRVTGERRIVRAGVEVFAADEEGLPLARDEGLPAVGPIQTEQLVLRVAGPVRGPELEVCSAPRRKRRNSVV